MKSNLTAILSAFMASSAAAQQGAWEPWTFFGDSSHPNVAAVNLVHVFDSVAGTAKFLAMTYEVPAGCFGGYARLWTPPPMGNPGNPGTFEAVATCNYYPFCQGHSALSDGSILMAGGFFDDAANLFSPWLLVDPPGPPASNQWNNPITPPRMTYQRWYPTCSTLPDGKVLVTSGWKCDPSTAPNNPRPCPPPNDPWIRIPELYNPTTNTWSQVSSAFRQQELYPYMFVLPDGSLLDAGPEAPARVLNTPYESPPSAWTWGTTLLEPSWPVPLPPGPTMGGSAVMYEPGKVMKCGGGGGPGIPARDSTWVVDASQAPIFPEWLVASRMHHARMYHNLVMLPDGKVLAVGGCLYDGPASSPVFEAEIFDPASGKWTLQPPSDASQYRMYHSTAALLPDGRVVSAGGNDYRTAQIFKPPYITEMAPRTTILQAPAFMQYGQNYVIQYAANGGPKASKACLIRLASTTHGFDQDQRYVPLKTDPDPNNPNALASVEAPANANLAPPGYYMLFLLSEYGKNRFAPSVMAKYVRVGP